MCMFEADYMIFCQSVNNTPGKMDLLGILDTIHSPSFPVDATGLVVFVPLRTKKTVTGDASVAKVEIEHENKVIFSTENDLRRGGSLPKDSVVITETRLIKPIIPAPGVYHVKLYVDDRLVITRKLYAKPDSEMRHPLPDEL